jgi:hypothetical protein
MMTSTMDELIKQISEILSKEFKLSIAQQIYQPDIYEIVSKQIIQTVCEETKAKTMPNGETLV